jgi:hypothetical protein
MSLKQFGGTFLSAKEITEGLKGEIIAPGEVAMKEFHGETKRVCEFKMHVAGSPDERIWSAGKFAENLLAETLGFNSNEWKFPVKGHFEIRPWQTPTRNGYAAHFIPDGSNGGKALAKSLAVARTVMEDVPTSSGSASPTRITLECPMCPEKFSGTNQVALNALLVSHLDSHKKAKKEGDKK